jgi:hypothetical protein
MAVKEAATGANSRCFLDGCETNGVMLLLTVLGVGLTVLGGVVLVLFPDRLPLIVLGVMLVGGVG